MTNPGRSEVDITYETPFTLADDVEWASLVRVAAYLGIAVGAARLVLGWWYLPPARGFVESFSYGVGFRYLFPILIRGVAMVLVGVTLLAASGACLARKSWAPTLMLLSEPIAAIVLGVGALASIADLVLDPNRRTDLSFGLMYTGADLVANLSYPLLACVIFRTRAARRLFRDQAVELAADPSGGENT